MDDTSVPVPLAVEWKPITSALTSTKTSSMRHLRCPTTADSQVRGIKYIEIGGTVITAEQGLVK